MGFFYFPLTFGMLLREFSLDNSQSKIQEEERTYKHQGYEEYEA